MRVLRAAAAVLYRDLLSEVRQWQALNVIVMFAVISLMAVSVGLKGDRIDNPTIAAELLWIVIFFTSMGALSRSFVREEDARTATALRLCAPAEAVYLGKLALNLLLMLALDLVLLPGFLLLVNRPARSTGALVAMVIGGSLALAVVSTILAAMAARAGSRSTLFAVLAFPLLLPVLVPAIHGTAVAFGGVGEFTGDLRWIFSYGIMCLIAALMFFPATWWG